MASKPVAPVLRSYLYKVDARCNAGKLSALEALNQEWVTTISQVGEHLWSRFLSGVADKKSLSSAVGAGSVFDGSPLVTSVKQCMAVACEGALQSWKSNLSNRIAKLVMRSDKWARADEVERHQLLWLNRLGLWRVPFAEQAHRWAEFRPKAAPLSAKCSRVLARYVQRYLRAFRAPNFERLPLQVNQMSSVLRAQSEATLDGVSHWLRISTLKRGTRIELPLRGNAYADQFAGPHALTFSFFKKSRGWYVKVVKNLPAAQSRTEGMVLGLDFGMTNLMAGSNGSVFERGFSHRLKKWDEALMRLQKGLQGAGELRLGQCRRYRDFVRRFRRWLRGCIGQVVNKALDRFNPQTVVIEALGFHAQAGNLSARMNRLVRKMGSGIFKEMLERKAPVQGFVLAEVNPAYTSQTCRSCGFIARANRAGNRFKCVCCERQGHADALAAANLVERFHQQSPRASSNHKTLGVQGLQRWGERMLARIRAATPGTSRHQGALRCARVGVLHLEKKRSPVLQASASIKELLPLLNLNIDPAVQVT